MVSSSRRRFRGRINPVSGGTAALSRLVRIHFRRFRYWRVLYARNRRYRRNDFFLPKASESVRPRRALLLWPVSHSPTVCHLARTPHSRSADLDVSLDLYSDPGRAQRVGNGFGKRHQRVGQQARLAKKKRARLALLLLVGFFNRTRSRKRILYSAKGAAFTSSLGQRPRIHSIATRQR